MRKCFVSLSGRTARRCIHAPAEHREGWFGLTVEPGVLAGVMSGIYKIVTPWSPFELVLHRANSGASTRVPLQGPTRDRGRLASRVGEGKSYGAPDHRAPGQGRNAHRC